jgi:hypothetical protein
MIALRRVINDVTLADAGVTHDFHLPAPLRFNRLPEMCPNAFTDNQLKQKED